MFEPLLGQETSYFAHLISRPPARSIGQSEPWRGDAVVDLGPSPFVARWLETDETSLVPHEGDLAPGHREINEPHRTAVLHASNDAAARTAHQVAHEFNVNLGNRRFVVDSEHPDSLEVDEEEVHKGRVSNHGGLPICRSRETTDLQGPRPSPNS